jgi:hypothetical protein
MSKEAEKFRSPNSVRAVQRSVPRPAPNDRTRMQHRGAATRSRQGASHPDVPVEIQIDASTVTASADSGVLKIAAAPGVRSIDICIEQFADGSLLISDKFGCDELTRVPDFHAVVHALSIFLGATGDDKLRLDIPPDSRIAGNVRVFDFRGDEIPFGKRG